MARRGVLPLGELPSVRALSGAWPLHISGPFKMVYSASTVARCRVVLHEPLYCACGKSFVEPPVVPVSAEHRLWNVHRACPCNLLQTEFCGTKPPECDEPCGQLQGP